MLRRVILVALALGTAPRVSAHPAGDARLGELSALVAARPGAADLLVLRAQVLEEAGCIDLAREDLVRAAALDAGVPAALELARLELRAGRPEDALAAADTFLATRPADADGLVARALSLARLGRDAGASWEAALDAAEIEGRPAPELYLEASRSLGVGVLDRGLARLGPVPTLLAAGIESERDAGRLDGAIARCRDAASRTPSGVPAPWRVLEGRLLVLAGCRDAARGAFERALAEVQGLPPHARRSRLARDVESEARASLMELAR